MTQEHGKLIPLKDINRVLTDREFIDAEHPELRRAYYDTQMVQEGLMPKSVGELVDRVQQNRALIGSAALAGQIEDVGICAEYVSHLLDLPIIVGAMEQPCPITQNMADLGQFGGPKDLEDFIRTPHEIAAVLQKTGLDAEAAFITFGSYQIGRGISDHSNFSFPGKGDKYTQTQHLSLIPKPFEKQGYDSISTLQSHIDKICLEGEKLKKTIHDNTRKRSVRDTFLSTGMDCRDWTPEQYSQAVDMMIADVHGAWMGAGGKRGSVAYTDFITTWNDIFTTRLMGEYSLPTVQPLSIESFGTYGIQDPLTFFSALVEMGAYADQESHGVIGIKPVRLEMPENGYTRWVNMQVIDVHGNDLLLADPSNPDFQISFAEAQQCSKQGIEAGGKPKMVLGKNAAYFLESSGLMPQLVLGDDGVSIPSFRNCMDILVSGSMFDGLRPIIWPYSAKTMVAADIFEKAKARGQIELKMNKYGEPLGDYYDYLDTHALDIRDGSVQITPYEDHRRHSYCTLDYYAEIIKTSDNQ